MNAIKLNLTDEQLVMLEIILKSDVYFWREMSNRPTFEIGNKAVDFAKTQIKDLQAILFQLGFEVTDYEQ